LRQGRGYGPLMWELRLSVRSGRVYQDFGGGKETEREGVRGFFEAQVESFRRGVFGGERDVGPGEKPLAVDVLKERGGLVEDAGDFLRGVERTVGEGEASRLVDFAFGGGNGVAVGIGAGMAEESVDAFEDVVRDRVFESVGLGMHERPVEAEVFDKEQFDQAMAAQHMEGKLFAARGEADPGAGFIFYESGVGQRLDHGGRGARDDAHRVCQPSHRDGRLAAALFGVDLLDVVFDGAGGHDLSPDRRILDGSAVDNFLR
jgi:hypothetical protein